MEATLGAEATLWRFFPPLTVPRALPFSVLAVVVERPLAKLALRPTILITTRTMGVTKKPVEK